MGILSSIGKGLKKALDVNLAVFAAPVTTLTKGAKAGIAKVEKQSATERTLRILGTTAAAAGTVLGAGTAAGRAAVSAAAKKVGSALVPRTPKGVITAAVATPVIAGAVARRPKEVAKTVAKAPGELAKFGGDLAELGADPSLETAKELIKESPLLTAGAGLIISGAAVGTAARVAAPIVGGAISRANQKSEVVVKESAASAAQVAPVAAPVSQATVGAAAPTAPVTPQTKTVTKTPSKKRRKRRTATKKRSVNQRVNIVISNKTTGQRVTNKYIKEACLN